MGTKKATIVLEGGAARGVFSAGAIDYLMEKDLYFSHVIGVSAGSCCGMDYVSKQIGRTRDCMIFENKEYSYINLRKFVKTRSLMDMDTFFEKFPREVFPFDFETYFASESECYITVTNCETGQAEFLTEREDEERLLKMARASCSLPLVAPIVNIDGNHYLDGGLADSVPIKKAMELENEKVVVVLTRNAGYRKSPSSRGLANIYTRAYRKYPNLIRDLRLRAKRYNWTLEYIDWLEEQGRIFVIRPIMPTVSRLESNQDTLNNLFQHGYDLMGSRYDDLVEYLNKS